MRSESGVAMIEATIGITLLLFVLLLAMQLVLVFHGALAGHTAAMRSARTLAVTGDFQAAQATFARQTDTALRSLHWPGMSCDTAGGRAACTVAVEVPAILPGAGLFTGGGLAGPVTIAETGYYPIGDRSGY